MRQRSQRRTLLPIRRYWRFAHHAPPPRINAKTESHLPFVGYTRGICLAEYYAEFRTDISAFVSQEVIDGCVAHGVFELPPGASDAMTLAIAHRVGDTVILDAVREIQSPFNPDAATTEFSTLLKAYRVGKVIGDRYGGEWIREPFRRHGVDYQLSEVSKSDIYRDALPLFNAGRAQLLDLKRLVNQLCSLERRTARGGRDLLTIRSIPAPTTILPTRFAAPLSCWSGTGGRS